MSAWSDDGASSVQGLSFTGNATKGKPFAGKVGTECLVNVATERNFGCGPGQRPVLCPARCRRSLPRLVGLEAVRAARQHAACGSGAIDGACSDNDQGNWYDAPWIGLSLGELARAGSFSDCQCYAKDGSMWWLGDGCGQFNAFEVVNDNNQYRNLEVFSTNFFGYAGLCGRGPVRERVRCRQARCPSRPDRQGQECRGRKAAPLRAREGPRRRLPPTQHRLIAIFLLLLDVPRGPCSSPWSTRGGTRGPGDALARVAGGRSPGDRRWGARASPTQIVEGAGCAVTHPGAGAACRTGDRRLARASMRPFAARSAVQHRALRVARLSTHGPQQRTLEGLAVHRLGEVQVEPCLACSSVCPAPIPIP